MPTRPVIMGVVLVALVVAGAALGAAGESVQVEGSMDIPDRTVTYQDRDFDVKAVKRADPGDTISVSATVVDDDPYRVHIRNGDDDLVASSDRLTSNATVSFDLTNYTAGTYMVGVNQDGYYRAIQPLVVRGYAVSADIPPSAESDGSLNATIDITHLRGDTAEVVQLVIGNDTHLVETNATANGSVYEASIDLGSLSPGTYASYAVVRGPDMAFGRLEMLGTSDRTNVEVDGETTEASTGSTGASRDDATTTPATATSTATASPTSTVTPTASPTATATATGTDPSPTRDEVLTPLDTVTPTDTAQPGLGLIAALLAILAAAVRLRR